MQLWQPAGNNMQQSSTDTTTCQHATAHPTCSSPKTQLQHHLQASCGLALHRAYMCSNIAMASAETETCISIEAVGNAPTKHSILQQCCMQATGAAKTFSWPGPPCCDWQPQIPKVARNTSRVAKPGYQYTLVSELLCVLGRKAIIEPPQWAVIPSKNACCFSGPYQAHIEYGADASGINN